MWLTSVALGLSKAGMASHSSHSQYGWALRYSERVRAHRVS